MRADPVALGARDAHPEQQQIRGSLVVADEGVDAGARRGELAVLELQLGELVRGFREVRPERQGAAEVGARLIVPLGRAQAYPGVGVGRLGGAIQRVVRRLLEAPHALLGATVLAQVHGVVVHHLRVVRRQPQRGAELRIRLVGVVHALEQHRAGAVNVGAARVLGERPVELVLRQRDVPLVQVGDPELHVVGGRIVRLAGTLRGCAGGEQQRQRAGRQARRQPLVSRGVDWVAHG